MNNEKFPVIILAGWSCSGKSTIAKELANITGFELVEVYEVYREIALSKGYRRSREWLYDVGSKWFAIDTSMEIANRILRKLILDDFNKKGFIIDASLGAKMSYVLKKKLPDIHIINIAIWCNKDIRLCRMERRMNVSVEEARKELRFRDAFLESVNVRYVMKKADFEVYVLSNLDSFIEWIVGFLEGKRIIKSEKIC